MATKKAATVEEAEIQIVRIETGSVTFSVLGQTPLIYNAMSQKVRQGLLSPPPKKNASEKASTLKHNPLQEYRDSVYRTRSDKAPTRLVFPAGAFKKAFAGAATDVPGVQRAPLARLTWVEGTDIAIYGIPQMYMAVVRSSDMQRTPDVRTRAILTEWAAHVTISFQRPILRDKTVADLFAFAGKVRGIGDGRVEKGALNFGMFAPVSSDDPDFARIVATQGREAQDAALESPEFYDTETEELYSWFVAETARRGFKVAA